MGCLKGGGIYVPLNIFPPYLYIKSYFDVVFPPNIYL